MRLENLLVEIKKTNLNVEKIAFVRRARRSYIAPQHGDSSSLPNLTPPWESANDHGEGWTRRLLERALTVKTVEVNT